MVSFCSVLGVWGSPGDFKHPPASLGPAPVSTLGGGGLAFTGLLLPCAAVAFQPPALRGFTPRPTYNESTYTDSFCLCRVSHKNEEVVQGVRTLVLNAERTANKTVANKISMGRLSRS